MKLSIVIAVDAPGDALHQQLSGLEAFVPAEGEVLCVSESPRSEHRAAWSLLAARHRWLRVIELDPPGCGLAAALRAGCRAAGGERIVVLPAGAEYPLDGIPHLLRALDEHDAAIACRRSVAQRFNASAAPGDLRTLRSWTRDPESAFMAMKRSAAESLLAIPGFQTMAAQWLVGQGYRVAEVVVEHRVPQPAACWGDRQLTLANWAASSWLVRQQRHPRSVPLHRVAQSHEGTPPLAHLSPPLAHLSPPLPPFFLPLPPGEGRGEGTPLAEPNPSVATAASPPSTTPVESPTFTEAPELAALAASAQQAWQTPLEADTRVPRDGNAPSNIQAEAHRPPRGGSSKPLQIFFSAGEPSGDLHGAHLIAALRQQFPGAQFSGFGGPKMAAAGCQLLTDLTALAVMWFVRVLANLHRFLRLLADADRVFAHHKPDAVVLIDFPGFNWWVARRAKAHGIPVFYYAPPQVWAWASWRVHKMRRLIDHVLCGLPFEATWFREQGCRATFIGHPYFDELRGQRLDAEFVAARRALPDRQVVILPGSRTQEVAANLPGFLKAAAHVLRSVPNARLAIAAFKESQAATARQMVKAAGLPIEVYVGRTAELIETAHCAMACSGSVSLELLYRTKPSVVLYQVSPLAFWVQGFFKRVKYITLVNLLAADELYPRDLSPYDPQAPGAERVPFPEYLTSVDRSQQIAAHVIEWLSDDARYAAAVAQLEALRAQVAHGGAAAGAAGIIAEALGGAAPVAPPHFLPGARTSSGYHYA